MGCPHEREVHVVVDGGPTARTLPTTHTIVLKKIQSCQESRRGSVFLAVAHPGGDHVHVLVTIIDRRSEAEPHDGVSRTRGHDRGLVTARQAWTSSPSTVFLLPMEPSVHMAGLLARKEKWWRRSPWASRPSTPWAPYGSLTAGREPPLMATASHRNRWSPGG